LLIVNVLEILNRYNIDYVDRGNNVAKGNVNVQCPWCGEDDHSQHLGINLETGMWGCWRNVKHRGRKLYRLLAKLTGLSSAEARRATGEGALRAVQQGDMERAVQGLTEGPESIAERTDSPVIQLYPTFREMYAPGVHPMQAESRFRNYLVARGFPRHNHKRLVHQYDLRYCVAGRFSDRLIIPIYENGKLMTWIARSVYKDASLRYLALEEEESVKQVKDCLYNYDAAMEGGDVLFFVEGALDAMKIDFYSQRNGVRAVGLFNMNLEAEQQELVNNLHGRFLKHIILLDEGQLSQSLDLQARLEPLLGHVLVRFMKPEWNAKDPGDLTPRQVRRLDGRI